MIIIGGRNYYPQDLEATSKDSCSSNTSSNTGASSIIRLGCSAAFTVDPLSGGKEEVAMILGLKNIPIVKV